MAKFKVGDKVKRIICGNGCNHNGKWNYFRVGEVGVVTKVRDDGSADVEVGGKLVKGNDPMYLRLVENHRDKKIVITTDGKTTTARLFDGKELIRKAEAKCSPDDEFDFMVGAKLAMERLKEKKFTPHLDSFGENYGNIGEKTNIKDAIGRELRIGDTVELYDGINCVGEKAIVFDVGKAFVTGIEMRCTKDGTIHGGWQIIKKRSFEEVAHGEDVDGIKYIKEA